MFILDAASDRSLRYLEKYRRGNFPLEQQASNSSSSIIPTSGVAPAAIDPEEPRGCSQSTSITAKPRGREVGVSRAIAANLSVSVDFPIPGTP
jgi:hypothetical protein